MADGSFSPEARLRRSVEFSTVFRRGRRFVRAGFVVIVAPGPSPAARLGLAVARRRVPRAVDRNRIKRVVRESFRRTRERLGPVDVVVLARGGTAEMPNHRLFAQLQDIWSDVTRWRRGATNGQASRRAPGRSADTGPGPGSTG